MSVEIQVLKAQQAKAHFFEIAQLRINIFKEFPYIYDGSIEYEVQYLGRYLAAPNAHFVLAIEASKIVGLATCLPLIEEEDFVKKGFENSGYKIDEVFYFGESVLLPEFRGQGVGHLFFNEREKVAKNWGALWTGFCAVERPENHPLRPAGYKPLSEFWQKRGYQKIPNLVSEFSWKDIGETSESAKTMTYWMKEIK